MSRLLSQADMNTDQLVRCSSDARALLYMIDHAAWAIQNNSGPVDVLADSIGASARLALELLEPVHDALETHEGLRQPSEAEPEPVRMVGGERNG